MKIAIDIGHASGTGACGNNIEEHSQCEIIGKYLQQKLQRNGFESEIVDFPDSSNRSDLNQTVQYINNSKFDITISLHCDCSDNPQAKGAHVCYVSQKGMSLASFIAERLRVLLPGRSNTIVKRDNLAILDKTNSITVLCECGFISNYNDSIIIKNKKDDIAECIFQGIKSFIKGL